LLVLLLDLEALLLELKCHAAQAVPHPAHPVVLPAVQLAYPHLAPVARLPASVEAPAAPLPDTEADQGLQDPYLEACKVVLHPDTEADPHLAVCKADLHLEVCKVVLPRDTEAVPHPEACKADPHPEACKAVPEGLRHVVLQ